MRSQFASLYGLLIVIDPGARNHFFPRFPPRLKVVNIMIRFFQIGLNGSAPKVFPDDELAQVKTITVDCTYTASTTTNVIAIL